MDAWIQREIDRCEFSDRRLKTRLGKILQGFSERIGQTIPTACRDWAATKAAYRFFDHGKVDEGVILAGHFAATRQRVAEAAGRVLILHDTTEVSFKRKHPEKIGQTSRVTMGVADEDGRRRSHTVCGMLLHASLATTTSGVPLGLCCARFWTRKKFKDKNALEPKVNPTRIPIEEKESYRWIQNVADATATLGDPDRCVHVGDREADIFELFSEAASIGTHFLVRTCVDRRAGEGSTTISKKMARSPLRGEHEVEVVDSQGRRHTARLRVRFERMTVHPPIGKEKRYAPLQLTVIHAREIGKPKDRDPLEWKLLTDLPVESMADAAEKLDWYAGRWKVETYFKVLKSGCRIEDRRLETAERLANLLAVCCVVAWRVFLPDDGCA